jgi:ribosomal protein S18 acetylase RimI-like enzyme
MGSTAAPLLGHARTVPLDEPSLRSRFPVDDVALSRLHGRAFGRPGGEVQPWASQLQRHSLTWVGAFDADALLGFVNACWDGGVHAFLLDAVVDPDHQRRGIGRRLVLALVAEVRNSGCEWLHVDYEPHLGSFYRDACGFRATEAGVIRLAP